MHLSACLSISSLLSREQKDKALVATLKTRLSWQLYNPQAQHTGCYKFFPSITRAFKRQGFRLSCGETWRLWRDGGMQYSHRCPSDMLSEDSTSFVLFERHKHSKDKAFALFPSCSLSGGWGHALFPSVVSVWLIPFQRTLLSILPSSEKKQFWLFLAFSTSKSSLHNACPTTEFVNYLHWHA
jgi:hypothetical protein